MNQHPRDTYTYKCCSCS